MAKKSGRNSKLATAARSTAKRAIQADGPVTLAQATALAKAQLSRPKGPNAAVAAATLFHAYDFAIPDGRGVCHHGPWLQPTFNLRKFPTRAAAFEVVKEMLTQFAAMLRSLETFNVNVTFVNGQGTLAPRPSSWHNELHPAKDGFNAFADLFHQKLKGLFPTRVP